MDHVKVAVRVRPFNQREKQRNAKCIISMENQTTLLYNPSNLKEEPKKFTFDYSYWSHDGFIESNDGPNKADFNHPNGLKYADQEKVYTDLGRSVLNNALEGYNAAIFAYGQTGSGKSYSVIGYGGNKGIVPRLYEELFSTIEHRKNGGDKTIFEVYLSMLEIYNEVVRDLLNPDSLAISNKKKGLKVREHPSKGFYAEGLKSFLVTSRDEIDAKIEEGTTNRSIASTNMNETSSRAHTIVAITLMQKLRNSHGDETAKASIIHLVDLAGSERLSGTLAIGNRLKEGVSINQSLSCLGNCIHALAEKAIDKNVRVPYRDSVLTRLLMNVLAGNSKTVMIATISPADINYDETMSTLRYADRAKQIRVHATINENSVNKLIRQLREENEKLKRTMEKRITELPGSASTDSAMFDMKRKLEEEMKALIEENDRQMKEMKQSYEEKLQKRRKSNIETDKNIIEQEKQNNPYLSNLNFDEQLSGKIIHIIKYGVNKLGKSDQCDIILYGPSIQDQHAIIYRKENGTTILEKVNDDCRILVNGDLITSKVHLNHNDRLLFGTTQLFVFVHLDQIKKLNMSYSEVTFELAQEEIASKAGFDVSNQDQSMETALLNKDLLELLPSVEEANAISEELNKNVKFEIILVSPLFFGKTTERTEVLVKVIYPDSGLDFQWSKEKFMDRLYIMKEMYQNYEQSEDWDLPLEKDPFYEDPNTDSLIGSVQLYLQPLAFCVELKEQLELIDYKGSEVGIINVEIVPCSNDGREYSEIDDKYVDSPSELIGKNFYFVVKINRCRGLSPRYTDIYCKYRVFLDTEDTTTEVISGTSNPDFNHRKIFSFTPATKQLIDYLKDSFILIQVFGKQMIKRSTSKQLGRLTKQMMQDDLINQANNLMQGFKINGRNVDPTKQSIIVELLLMKKQQERQQQRIENLRKLVETSERYGQPQISVEAIKKIITSTPPEEQEIIRKTDNDEYEANKSNLCSIL